MSGFEAEWARCAPWVQAALDYAGGTHRLGDVRDAVLSGEAQFWPGERSAVVTEVVVYPRAKAVRFWLAGGDLGELKAMEKAVVAWAKGQGCDRAEILGRGGWERALEGYARTCVALGRSI